MKTTVLAAAAASALLSLPATAAVTSFTGTLAPEVLGATGSGWVSVVHDSDAHTLAIDTSFSGLSGTTTVAHIHCCTAVPGTATIGVAVTPSTLPGFPTGLTSASYSVVLDLTDSASFTSGFTTNFGGGTIAGSEAALLAGMMTGKAYFNVHSGKFPGGEIRSFLAPVPEPSTYALMLLGIAAVGAAARRRAA